MVNKLKDLLNVFKSDRRVRREYLASGRLSNIDLDKLILLEEMWFNINNELRRIISVDDTVYLNSKTKIYLMDNDNLILPISLDIIIKMINDKLWKVKSYELTTNSTRKDIHNLIDYLYLIYTNGKR